MRDFKIRSFGGALLAVTLLVLPANLRAQVATASPGDPKPGVTATIGSVFLSLLYVPVKLTTCVGTQAVAAVAYTATFGVPGNYDGGSNGKQIGEIAHKSCTGDWFITPEQVARDYR